MIVVPPVLVRPSNVLLTNIDDTYNADPPDWTDSVAYSQGDLVKRPNDRTYKFLLTGPTIDSTEPEISAVSSLPKWLDYGYINKYKLFEYRNTDKTIYAGTFDYTIYVSERIDTMAFLGMENVLSIQVVQLTLDDDILNVYDLDNSTGVYEGPGGGGELEGPGAGGPEGLDYPSPSYYENRILTNIVPAYNVKYQIILTTSGEGYTAIRYLALGLGTYLGAIQRGIGVSADNYSQITKDDFGTSSLVQRRNVPKISCQVVANSTAASKLLTLRKELNAQPVVWSGLDDKVDELYYDSLLMMGVYKRFSIGIENPITTNLTLELEEL